jgi:hypothetical protein
MEENLVHGLSGGLSSIVSTAVVHPFETMRVKMQSEESSVYFLSYLIKVYREEGIKGIYAGFGVNIVQVATSYAIYFFSYQHIKRVISDGKMKLSIKGDALASFLASAVVIVILSPLWTVSTRLVKDKSKSFWNVTKQIYLNEGIAGFFKGATMSLVLTMNPVIQYTCYEYLKRRFPRSAFVAHLLFGAIAKFIATLFTYPMQTIRTRLQLNEKENKSMWDDIFELLSKDRKTIITDFMTTYNGFFSKCVQTVLNSAIILSLHEKITSYLMNQLLNIPKIKIIK